MQFKLPLYLNIRQKVIAAFTLLVIVTGSIGLVSYHHLREIERKQHFVEITDDLSNYILEARRYEKNFLLYDSGEDLEENRRYIRLGTELIEKIAPETKDLKGLPVINEIERRLNDYGRAMEQLGAKDHAGAANDSSVQDQLREHGKALVDASRDLASFERQRILDIVKTLKTQLLASIGLTIIIGGLLLPITYQKIIRPLRIIERTTHRIAEGDFRLIDVSHSHDETQRVVEAFNRMICELEKRQDQLLQAKKMSSLGTLTSGIAHQLNNPLNNISTSCQILLEEFGQTDAEFSRKMLTNIEGEVHRARDIVRDLLEFSRIKEFCLAPVQLSQVIDRSISLMSSQIPPGIEIIKSVPEDLCLNLDAQRMQQVFLNLFENAVHAIDPPGRIRISAGMEASTDQVIIQVDDTGAGISEAVRGRIFDPFFTTKEVGSGTGLGLSVVFGIIQKHRGSISVESKEQEGTRFIIGLPLESKG
jgi:signal transduction histidine kinase